MESREFCPKCESDDLENTDQPYYGDGTFEIKVECVDCGHSWSEIYTLTSIVDEEN